MLKNELAENPFEQPSEVILVILCFKKKAYRWLMIVLCTLSIFHLQILKHLINI